MIRGFVGHRNYSVISHKFWYIPMFVRLIVSASNKEPASVQYIDPAMIGVLVGMALMFVIICVVLRLFSKARWRENRTIFNTPNPRLMNVSLLKDSKLLHQERRGSRAPSRAPSVSSLRPHSPQPNQGMDKHLGLHRFALIC